MLRAMQRGREVELDHLFGEPWRCRSGFGEGGASSIVDEDIEAAETLRDSVDQGFHFSWVANVGCEEGRGLSVR